MVLSHVFVAVCCSSPRSLTQEEDATTATATATARSLCSRRAGDTGSERGPAPSLPCTWAPAPPPAAASSLSSHHSPAPSHLLWGCREKPSVPFLESPQAVVKQTRVAAVARFRGPISRRSHPGVGSPRPALRPCPAASPLSGTICYLPPNSTAPCCRPGPPAHPQGS